MVLCHTVALASCGYGNVNELKETKMEKIQLIIHDSHSTNVQQPQVANG